jgi:hypothetical protein
VQESYSFPYNKPKDTVEIDTEIDQWESLPEMYVGDEAVEHLKDLTSRVETPLEDIINLRIVIPNVSDVRNYLMKHSDMGDLLYSVCNRALEVFGETAQLSLEVYHDSETRSESLTIYVRQDEYQEDIMDKIKKVWAAYKNFPDRNLGRLFVTTDFEPPLTDVSI